MWSTILGVVFGLIGKIFGIGKSDTQAAQEAGEKQGRAEQAQATDDKIIQDVAAANAARDTARNDPGGVRGPDVFSRD